MVNIKTINYINKDIINRKKFLKIEINKLILKSLIYNNNYPFFFKYYFDKIFKKFLFNLSISKFRTYCIFLGNSKSIFRKFKFSRIICKKYASNGYIIGLKKSSF
jgi:ribosomal protein S14